MSRLLPHTTKVRHCKSRLWTSKMNAINTLRNFSATTTNSTQSIPRGCGGCGCSQSTCVEVSDVLSPGCGELSQELLSVLDGPLPPFSCCPGGSGKLHSNSKRAWGTACSPSESPPNACWLPYAVLGRSQHHNRTMQNRTSRADPVSSWFHRTNSGPRTTVGGCVASTLCAASPNTAICTS